MAMSASATWAPHKSRVVMALVFEGPPKFRRTATFRKERAHRKRNGCGNPFVDRNHFVDQGLLAPERFQESEIRGHFLQTLAFFVYHLVGLDIAGLLKIEAPKRSIPNPKDRSGGNSVQILGTGLRLSNFTDRASDQFFLSRMM